MDRHFLELYELELQHLREVAGEFAAEHKKVAARLDLSTDARHLSRDPYVNMLLQGTAYLAARVHHKLDSEFPRFTQSLLEVIFPDYLRPVPAMAIIGFTPQYSDASLAKGFQIPRGTLLRTHLGKGERTPCIFQTAHPLSLWPIRLADAAYHHSRALEELRLPSPVAGSARAALRFRLEATAALTFKQLGPQPGESSPPLDRVVFHIRDDGQGFLRGPGRIPGLIYEQLFAHAAAVVVQFTENHQRRQVVLPPSSVQPVGFDDDHALLPPTPRVFQGYRLLREYFAFPDRFLFFAITGLEQALQQCPTPAVDLIVVLDQEEPAFLADSATQDQPSINKDRFSLYATPAINLFPKNFDRVTLNDQFSEIHIVPDNSLPLDFEIYSLESVTGFGSRPEDRQEFHPFYSARDLDDKAGAFFMLYREPRALTGREQQFGYAPSYLGCETYLSLVDAQAAPYGPGLKQLGFRGLCTNRHLPLTMAKGLGATDFFPLDFGGPFQSEIRCLSGPTHPLSSPGLGKSAWPLISHLALNYLSLADLDTRRGAAALREILMLYLDDSRREFRRQIEGLLSVRLNPVVRRIPALGPIAFARGLSLTLTLDEDAFSGSSSFILGAVLREFFARYVSINSFTETELVSNQRGAIMRWPPRLGVQQPV